MDHLSCSQINLYLQCPLKYKFLYIVKLPKPFRPSGLAFGGSIHAALAWLHKQRLNGNNISLEKLLKIFDADWYAQKLDKDIHFKNGETENKLTVMGKEMLSLYFNLSTGERLDMNIEGYIDLIEKDDTIVEFKTSNQAMNQNDADDHIQLTAYSYAYQMLYQRPAKLLKLIDFVKAKRPRIVPLEVNSDKVDCERFFYLAKQVLKGIKTRVFFPRASFMCKDCKYGESCRTWQGN
jgi:CRISPR/Cas system-associated exonuclease Cas4 (RecB family)